VSKVDDYRQKLRELAEWDGYLLRESGLPGPRGNIELAKAAALEGDERRFASWLRWNPAQAPTGTAEEFLTFCGALGQGTLVAGGSLPALDRLRGLASDPRWRLREAVAMALQIWGDTDMDALLSEMEAWAEGSPGEQRAAAASLCEPRLLDSPQRIRRVLSVLDRITTRIAGSTERRTDSFLALRKGLGYCWSVAVAAEPEAGKPFMEKWLASADPDVAWIMRENLRKARLARMDPVWVERQIGRLGHKARDKGAIKRPRGRRTRP
jgi:hypothetical protein